MQFTDFPFCDSLLKGLESMNFTETTPVQEQAIPVILEKTRRHCLCANGNRQDCRLPSSAA
jgi:superfamily II DNA/RNA helicase